MAPAMKVHAIVVREGQSNIWMDEGHVVMAGQLALSTTRMGTMSLYRHPGTPPVEFSQNAVAGARASDGQ